MARPRLITDIHRVLKLGGLNLWWKVPVDRFERKLKIYFTWKWNNFGPMKMLKEPGKPPGSTTECFANMPWVKFLHTSKSLMCLFFFFFLTFICLLFFFFFLLIFKSNYETAPNINLKHLQKFLEEQCQAVPVLYILTIMILCFWTDRPGQTI